ncbi:MAG TPA: DUF262 domain-containing protein [Alicycliphilus sp.]|nr:DUF262 domain-containing protein [Alicycliphilus sp.]
MNAPATTTNAPALSLHTSFARLFEQAHIQAIEIPLIQRDYAQGRGNAQVKQIRERFIDSLCKALESDNGIDLDFVFGDVVDKEHNAQKVPTLVPLDGQQRLTTLFLLHCYLAWHHEAEVAQHPWHQFSYATRPGARAFCQFLTKCRPSDMAQDTVSGWLEDQASYLPTWKHDPTIKGMLVMLDALHARYRDASEEQRARHWQRLNDPALPAIRFHLLPIRNTSENSTLYVKMNSRGKPLTAFENFKAEWEGLLRSNPHIPHTTRDDFSRKIDTEWSDLFWDYRDKNHQIDEQFMRYLRFLAEVLAWKQNRPEELKVNHLSSHDAQELARLAHGLFGPNAQHAGQRLGWMSQALDIWLEEPADGPRKPRPIQQIFEQLFTRTGTAVTLPLRVFNFRDFEDQEIGVDMFRACCSLYGTRSWRLAHTLLFYGVLQGFRDKISQADFQSRLRLLRNLIEASQDDIRAGERNNMPELLADVEKIMAGGPLDGIEAFNQVQVKNESDKRAFLAKHPTLQEALHRLEDHELLRGGLTVFDLNPEQDAGTCKSRATQLPDLFAQPYSQVAGALLALKHEGRSAKRNGGYRLAYLGAPKKSEPWENLFRARRGEKPHPSSASLMALLDEKAKPGAVIEKFASDPATPKDWRYYMVKYPAMRTGESGSHVIGPGAGYAMCMLRGDFCDNRSYHYDSYLFALAEAASIPKDRIGNDNKWPLCFSGDGTGKRQLELRNSGLKVQCVGAGWQFSSLPEDAQQRLAFDDVVKHRPLDKNHLYAVPQANGIDTKDRIALGAQLLRELIEAGL